MRTFKKCDRIFRSVLPNKNFMTPNLEGYYDNEKYVIELSSGTDWDGDKHYGVTVVDAIEKKHIRNLSNCFSSKDDAMNHINELLKS